MAPVTTPSTSRPSRAFLRPSMSPSSDPVLGAVTSSLPMASAMSGTTDRFGVWNIQEASSSGTMFTR